MALVGKPTIDVDDYLQGELVGDVKYEYINGEVWAMSGAKRAHNVIGMNLSRLLFAYLRNTPCRAFGSDMKVRVQTGSDDCFFYPRSARHLFAYRHCRAIQHPAQTDRRSAVRHQ